MTGETTTTTTMMMMMMMMAPMKRCSQSHIPTPFAAQERQHETAARG
jgi:hypothetical protein